MTGLVGISSDVVQGWPREGDCHPPR